MTKIENLKFIELNALPVYGNRCIKIKMRTYGDKFFTKSRSLNVPEVGKNCESFTINSIDSLLAYENKYYLQIYLDNCSYRVLNTQMIDYLDHNLFQSYKN